MPDGKSEVKSPTGSVAKSGFATSTPVIEEEPPKKETFRPDPNTRTTPMQVLHSPTYKPPYLRHDPTKSGRFLQLSIFSSRTCCTNSRILVSFTIAITSTSTGKKNHKKEA